MRKALSSEVLNRYSLTDMERIASVTLNLIITPRSGSAIGFLKGCSAIHSKLRI